VRFEEIDDERLDAWAGFLQAHAVLVGVLERDLFEQRGMPLTWYEVLLRLMGEPQGAMRMQDLARSVLLSKSGVTRVVDRMEAAGLVERQHCAADRRGTYAAITAAGRAAFRKALPVHLTAIRERFGAHLSDEEAVMLRQAFGRMVDANAAGAAEACDAAAASEGFASEAWPGVAEREPAGAS
jgi:DNA-binding MarR family transcriptional regulator